MTKDLEKFKALLDDTHEYPSSYTFKFIVPTDQIKVLREIMGDAPYEEKPSRKGNYVSYTATKKVGSSQEILDIYANVSTIPGILSL